MRRRHWKWWGVFFNNFHSHLPGGFHRSIPQEILRQPYRNPGASKRRRAITTVQFHALIDRLIEEVGLDRDEIERRVRHDDAEAIYVYVLPLYVRLRAEGFKRYPDLTA